MVKGHVVSLAGVGHVFFFHADNVGYFLQPLRFPGFHVISVWHWHLLGQLQLEPATE